MSSRNGSATWTGDLMMGSGELTVGEGTWTSAYSGRARFAGVLPGFQDGKGTNPEELFAAAHAACFSMALSLGLSSAGHPPSSIHTTAHVHLRIVGNAPAIQQIDLTTGADVPGLGQKEFHEIAEQAKASCIISRALGGVPHINLSASLDSVNQAGQRTNGSNGRTRMAVLAASNVASRIPAQDLRRARAFYAEKLGLEPIEERPGGLRYLCGNGEFALFESGGAAAGVHTQMAWQVDDLEGAITELRARGVIFEEYDVPGLTTVNGIAEVEGNYPSKGGNGEKAAWFKDSEGNLLAIGQAIT